MVLFLESVISSVHIRTEENKIDKESAKLALDEVLYALGRANGQHLLRNLPEAAADDLKSSIHFLRLSELMLKPLARQLADMGIDLSLTVALHLDRVYSVITNTKLAFEQRLSMHHSMPVNVQAWQDFNTAIEVVRKIKEHL